LLQQVRGPGARALGDTWPACGAGDLERLLSSFAVSSDVIRRAHLTSARNRAEQARAERRHEEHRHMQDHFRGH
jgi:hypothetical protein